MKIVINDKNSIKVGSVRVHVHNLYKYLKQINVNITLNDWNDYQTYDIVIFGKNVNINELIKAKRDNDKILIGDINPSDAKFNKVDIVDFFVVGCIEEKDYYLKYKKQILIFPQIEIFKENIKIHRKKKEIIIGYHGNKMHIDGISNELKCALIRLSKEQRIKLHLIYDVASLGKTKMDRQINCEYIQWDLDTFAHKIQECDIGIAPSLTKIPNFLQKLIKVIPSKSGFNNDVITRYKNTTNAGRTFVFFQLGIPVNESISPS